MKITYRLVGSISALAGILLMILLLINCILVQDGFLNGTNAKYKVYKNVSMSEEELKVVVHHMIGYVKGQLDSPQVSVSIKDKQMEFFNEKELGHLKDVRTLVNNLYITMWAFLLMSFGGVGYLIYQKKYMEIVKGIEISWIVLGVVTVVVGILALIDIDLVVTGFHKMFLSNSQWVLNPALDRSVWMFRTRMYGDVIVVLGSIVVAVAAVSLGAAFGMRKMCKEKGEQYGKPGKRN